MIKNANGFLDIDDNYNIDRIKAFFCLDDISESDNDSILNYLMSYRDEFSFNVMICLKLLGDHIVKSEMIFDYVSNYNVVKRIYLYLL